MAKFTLLELHLDDATLTANAPFSGEESDSTTVSLDSDADDAPADDAGGGPRVGPLVAALLALVVAGVVLRRLVGGADTEIGDEEPVDGPD